MRKIHIHRKSEWINRFRSIQIYLNGKRVNGVLNGESITLDVPSGANELQAKIDWCGSPVVQFDESRQQELHLELRAVKPMRWVVYLGMLSLIPYLFFQYTEYNMHQAFLIPVLVGFVIFFYYFTIGRNSYLQLQEVEHDI